ncbi:aspartate/glutamate racemase family protein [Aliamphritea spongicola]|uniref:aspartate/glutamate racemase family protein n=1 Tax=Aliamphritea spongicola TaxID=707589 RepID=UPI00196AF3A6|nr:aspartate/glutamate racemase family protein [Aliamphritea spongicola]MBN3560738.1 aspartate/glutamate racemase family protein [Aliamphritea spongicola]
MKTIGMLGGMSWESSADYYAALNRGVKQKLGGLHSAKVCMLSVDFAEIEQLQHAGDWQQLADILARQAAATERGGADFLLIATNTMHKVADEVEAAISIPLLHIADVTAEKLLADGVKTIGLLGTRFTMAEDFYKGRLTDKFGLQVLVPDADQQDDVHRIIYEELCQGEVHDSSRQVYLKIIDDLFARGAEGVILGCTEIAMLVKPEHTSVSLYDTTALHAEGAVKLALAEDF